MQQARIKPNEFLVNLSDELRVKLASVPAKRDKMREHLQYVLTKFLHHYTAKEVDKFSGLAGIAQDEFSAYLGVLINDVHLSSVLTTLSDKIVQMYIPYTLDSDPAQNYEILELKGDARCKTAFTLFIAQHIEKEAVRTGAKMYPTERICSHLTQWYMSTVSQSELAKLFHLNTLMFGEDTEAAREDIYEAFTEVFESALEELKRCAAAVMLERRGSLSEIEYLSNLAILTLRAEQNLQSFIFENVEIDLGKGMTPVLTIIKTLLADNTLQQARAPTADDIAQLLAPGTSKVSAKTAVDVVEKLVTSGKLLVPKASKRKIEIPRGVALNESRTSWRYTMDTPAETIETLWRVYFLDRSASNPVKEAQVKEQLTRILNATYEVSSTERGAESTLCSILFDSLREIGLDSERIIRRKSEYVLHNLPSLHPTDAAVSAKANELYSSFTARFPAYRIDVSAKDVIGSVQKRVEYTVRLVHAESDSRLREYCGENVATAIENITRDFI